MDSNETPLAKSFGFRDLGFEPKSNYKNICFKTILSARKNEVPPCGRNDWLSRIFKAGLILAALLPISTPPFHLKTLSF